MLFNRDTLLASLMPRMPQKVEDVATDCLVYILTKSKPARSALNSLIGNTVPDTVEECIRFNAQITEDGSRFDFVGYDQGDEKRVIGEAKLDADLGSGQGGGYLSQSPDSSSVLLFVVPCHRIDHLWGLKLLEIWCVLVDHGCFWSSCWGDISRCRLSGGC